LATLITSAGCEEMEHKRGEREARHFLIKQNSQRLFCVQPAELRKVSMLFGIRLATQINIKV